MSIENSIVFNFRAPVDEDRDHFACETSCGDGEIDERLGGEPQSGIVKCPDCNGWGYITSEISGNERGGKS
jgi:DnaJ-class molecular chaperone